MLLLCTSDLWTNLIRLFSHSCVKTWQCPKEIFLIKEKPNKTFLNKASAAVFNQIKESEERLLLWKLIDISCHWKWIVTHVSFTVSQLVLYFPRPTPPGYVGWSFRKLILTCTHLCLWLTDDLFFPWKKKKLSSLFLKL